MSLPASLEERQLTASSELSSLGRVSHRLALVDSSERLQQVLEKLLPRLLTRIGENHHQQLELARNPHESDVYRQLKDTHNKIHAKLVEMLSHTMKRVRDDQACKLPCKEVLQLLLLHEEDSVVNSIPKAKAVLDPFTLNLALTFITLGLTRCSKKEEVEDLLPSILVLVGQYSGLAAIRTPAKKMQSHQVGHLLLRAIERLVQDENKVAQSNYSDSKASTKSQKKHDEAEKDTDSIAASRYVLDNDTRAACAVWDLLLDGILYHPVAGNVPPNGVSQAGHERLKSGNSIEARDWAAEKAPSMKLMEFKLAILDIIAPTRRWAIFAGGSSDINVSRTVALLVVASGDPNPEVAQRASTYLKMHHDSFRGTTKETSTESPETSVETKTAAGDPLRLTCSLLSLALGQTNAESAMIKLSTKSIDIWLGLPPDETSTSDSTQLILSLKRRSVSESTAATIMKYVAEKILTENTYMFHRAQDVLLMATLPVLVAQRTLSNLRTSSSLSVLQAKPFVASAKLLNILCIRMSAFFDAFAEQPSGLDSITFNATITTLMARALATACVVLAPASSPISIASAPAAVSIDGSVSIRDSCYGVICSLSRSQFALAPERYIFTRGLIDQPSSGVGKMVSIDTASLLFGCASNELEVLRPRAVAALDALLGAYCRVFLVEKDSKQSIPEPHGDLAAGAPSNPWDATVSDAKSNNSGNDRNNPSVDFQDVVKSLLPLLWSASQTSQAKASRVAAAKWASDLIKAMDVTSASHLLCFLAGDADVTASAIAREGLGLPSKLSIATCTEDDFDFSPENAAAGDNQLLPDFGDFVSMVFPLKGNSKEIPSSAYWRPQYWDMSFSGRAAALRFGLVCLLGDIYGREKDAEKAFMSTLADTLILFGSKAGGIIGASRLQGRELIELLEECTRALLAALTTSMYARTLIVSSSLSGVSDVSLSLKDMEFLSLSVSSAVARKRLAASCGRLYADFDLWAKELPEGDDALTLADWLQASQVNSSLHNCANKLEGLNEHIAAVGETHGACFLGAQCVRSLRLFATQVKEGDDDARANRSWQSASTIIAALGHGILHSDDIVANASADALAVAFFYETIDAPILDPRLFEATAATFNNLTSALKKYSSTDHLDAPRITKLAKAAGRCLASSTSGAGVVSGSNKTGNLDLGPARLSCVEALFSLLGGPAFRADEEISLVVGETLAEYADAVSDAAIWSYPLAPWPNEYDETFAKQLPPHKQILYIMLRKVYASNSPHARTSSAPALLAIVARASRLVNNNEMYSRRPLVIEIKCHMAEVQNLFIKLLADPKSKHLSREACCLGLAACRGITTILRATQDNSEAMSSYGAEELNHKLLRAFGQTTHFGGSAYQETVQQAGERREAERSAAGRNGTELDRMAVGQFGEESEVGGASGLGEAALNSYREMASAAVCLGRIDVLYSLLILSISHPAWFTKANRHKYSASSLLREDSMVGSRTNSAELRAALRPHLGKLLPRILRATHDPNKQTREQMGSLWIGLTGGGYESRAAVTEHLLPIVDTLIDDCTSKLWRARSGACSALAEVLVGRSWEDLGGGPAQLDDDDTHTKTSTAKLTAGIRVLRLFRVAMRGLDDVRGAVRDSGEQLARTLRLLSIRLCTRSLKESPDGKKMSWQESQNHEKNASAASATVLRWLLKYGLNQQCAEATGICLSILVEIIDVVQPKILQPLIPDVLQSLLKSMSTLEPSALNYLQARSGEQEPDSALSYESLERIRLRLAQNGPVAVAVTKLLAMIPSVSMQTQREVVPQLDAALRQSVGFASRAATADAVSVLCNSCPVAFKFHGGGNTNPSVRLLRALYLASERERGQHARDKMVHSLGNLAALCPGSSVRVLARKACDKYTTSTGNNDDLAARRASAAALRSIAVRASNQLIDGGPSDVWANKVLPVAFLGKNDEDAMIASLWNEVWEEGSIAIDVSHTSEGSGFGGIEEKLLPYLVDECCRALMDYSWTRRVAGSNALVALCNSGVLSPSPRTVGAIKDTDSAAMKRAQRRAQASNMALKACTWLLSRSRLWTGKATVTYSLVSIASQWASAVIDGDLNGDILFGWTGADPCPWQPIVVSLTGFDDLFWGDGWFRQKREDEEVPSDKEMQRAEPEKTDAEEAFVGAMNFEDDDCELLPDIDEENKDMNPEASLKESNAPTFVGLVLFLVDQAMPAEPSKILLESDEFLPYRLAAFTGLRNLMASISESSSTGILLRRELFYRVTPRLVSMCEIRHTHQPEEPPVLVARAMDCLGAFLWEAMGEQLDNQGETSVPGLTYLLVEAGGRKQPSWTVREASRLCLASLASKCHAVALKDLKVVSNMVDSADQSQKDLKFWKVRLAGLKLLKALVARAGTRAVGVFQTSKEKDAQILLEAILPQKEAIVAIARKSLADPEAEVTALGSEILGMMSWWP